MVLQSQMPAVAQLYSCFIILLKLNMSYINKTFQTVVKYRVYSLFFFFLKKIGIKRSHSVYVLSV